MEFPEYSAVRTLFRNETIPQSAGYSAGGFPVALRGIWGGIDKPGNLLCGMKRQKRKADALQKELFILCTCGYYANSSKNRLWI